MPEKIFFWTLWCKGRYHRHTHYPTGRHSVRTNQRSTSLIPRFYARCPSCHNRYNLSWLGTNTKYAGLHTPGLGTYPVAWCYGKSLSGLNLSSPTTRLRLYLMSTSTALTPDHPKIYTTVSCTKEYPSQHSTQFHKCFDSSRDR